MSSNEFLRVIQKSLDSCGIVAMGKIFWFGGISSEDATV